MSEEQSDTITELCNKIGELFEELGLEGIAIVEREDVGAFTFYNKHFYDAATLTARVHNNFVHKIKQDISD